MNLYYIIIIFVILVYVFSIYNYNYIEQYSNNKDYKIFCLNMNKSKDRWKNIENYNKSQNLKIERFVAYDGKKLNIKNLINNNYLSSKNSLEYGQIGCAYSHVKLWEKCLKLPYKYFVILEDDIILPIDFEKKIECIIKNAPNNWDIVYLGGCYVKGNLINKQFIKPTALYYKYNLCTHAYIINKNCIPKVIKRIKPIEYPIDNQLRKYYKELNVYFYYKNIVKQNNNFKTTIAEENRINKHTLFHKYSDISIIV